jgi:two-component system phosphate regulon sensor histidine kinase PhoR
MFWRIFSFILAQLACGLAGWWLAGDVGAEAGLVAGAVVWFLIDLLRGLRVVRWLRRPETAPPVQSGLWGELVERMRRALRAQATETAEAQARLQEFLAAIQASPNGVVLLDSQGRIEWCNQTAAAHFGFDAERDVQQLIGNLVRDPAFAAYLAAREFGHEITVAGRGGSVMRPERISVQLHPYGQGRQLLVSRDVTALEQAEAMRRDFVANVSHEIRTPLTVLTGFVETLQTLPLPEHDRARYLDLMAQQASRMQTLVADLLTLSRLEGSPLPGAGEWTSLQVLQGQCEQEGRALSAVLGKAHRLHFEPAPALELAGVPSELLSAMSNLVSNAIRYTPDGGSIVAGWTPLEDGRAEFAVRDTGPGIAPEHLPRLTERFYRVDRSRSRETGGTGLGLAIVKHVVQRHGGQLRVDSTPGAGSRFAIVLPAARLRVPHKRADDAAEPRAAAVR